MNLHRTVCGVLLSALSVVAVVVAAQAQAPATPDPAPLPTTKPIPKPSASLGTRSNSEASQLPAGADNGVPGVGQNLPLGTAGTARALRRRAAAPAASDVPRADVNDSAAAKAAARPRMGAASAVSPGPSPKP